MFSNMSPFGHVLVLVLSFASCHSAKPDGDPTSPVSTGLLGASNVTTERNISSTELSSAKPPVEFTITSKKNGSLALKIKVVKEECTETANGLDREEASTEPSGTIKKPVDSCNDKYESGDFFLNASEPFQVYCDVEHKKACLKQDLKQSDLNRLAIPLEDKKTWLSYYTDTKLLYNKYAEDSNSLSDSPIKYLLSMKQIKSVTHVIKYYYSNENTTKSEDEKFSLAFTLWNGQTFETRDRTPLRLTAYKKIKCWDEDDSVDHTKWVCHDIKLEDTSNRRLPVTDVYIGELVSGLVSSTKQIPKIFFALSEFCIHYK